MVQREYAAANHINLKAHCLTRGQDDHGMGPKGMEANGQRAQRDVSAPTGNWRHSCK